MVICSYFLNNTCRFGTKCHNEHVNVKLTLKTDAESALKGNQWPLSSYGPFRDKPCIPNFIEDQSFEEIRHLCYEAKATGNVQMVTNQFTQNILDAKNKMNMLTNPTDDVAGMVTNLYNSTCTPTVRAPSGTHNQANTANPFGMTSNTMNSGGSIFAGGAGGNSATTNNSLFGSSAAANSNPFARNAAGFGNNAQSQTTNLFGGSTTSNSLFGGGNISTSGSLFGGSFSNANNTFGSVGGVSGGGVSHATSLFGGGVATSGPFSQQNATPFALASTTTNQMNTPSTGLFGAQAQANPIFGGGANFGNAQVKPGLFGQTTTGGNIFGQNPAPPAFGAQAQQTNPFGNAAQTSIFGGGMNQGNAQSQQQTMQSDNPFAAVAQSATTNIFGQSQMQQQPQASPFQSANNAFGGNANSFGQNANISQNANIGQSIFGGQSNINQNVVQAAQAPVQSLQQQQQSIFGANSFSAQPAAAPVQASFGTGGNIFQSVQVPTNQPLFGAQPQQQELQQQQQQFQQNSLGAPASQPIQQSKTLYTPMDSLSQEEIEAFNSTSFDISKIPTKPPPMELCI